MADLRSDTLTRPTDAMRAAMARAEVGDDVFGEDPTVRALERDAATVLGVEAAMFVPSGTMANQIAIHVHCRAGDEVICEERSHVVRSEAGGIARWTGAALQLLTAADGFVSARALLDAVQPDDVHVATSRLFVLENTHNMAGGTVLPPQGVQELVSAAQSVGLLVHVDGARIYNAAIALGCAVRELTRGVDSVSMCLSKGLGAPVGSVLGGRAEFIARARRARKAFGGGMRQAGILAAAGLLALHDGPAALALDHERAARLAAAWIGLRGTRPSPTPMSNIVMLDLAGPLAADCVRFLEGHGVRALAVRRDRVRFVTHRDLDDAAIERCIEAVHEWSRSLSATAGVAADPAKPSIHATAAARPSSVQAGARGRDASAPRDAKPGAGPNQPIPVPDPDPA